MPFVPRLSFSLCLSLFLWFILLHPNSLFSLSLTLFLSHDNFLCLSLSVFLILSLCPFLSLTFSTYLFLSPGIPFFFLPFSFCLMSELSLSPVLPVCYGSLLFSVFLSPSTFTNFEAQTLFLCLTLSLFLSYPFVLCPSLAKSRNCHGSYQ